MASFSIGSGTPRQATVADLPAITQLIRGAYARYADRMERLPAPVFHNYLDEAEAGQMWVIGDPISGVIVLLQKEQDSLLVENVAVDPGAQGAGLGRRLMEFAEEHARVHGLRILKLYTHEVMTENIAFYGRLGYHEVDRRTQDGYHRVFMEKPIAG